MRFPRGMVAGPQIVRLTLHERPPRQADSLSGLLLPADSGGGAGAPPRLRPVGGAGYPSNQI